MSKNAVIDNYINNAPFMSAYERYQERYFPEARRSDLALIELVGRHVARRGEDLALLDIGCSTGALLYHIRERYPSLRLAGGDLSVTSVARCQADERLAGIAFSVMDACNLERPAGGYDIVVANAVLYLFDDETLAAALKSIAAALNAGGILVVFDFFHPYEHDIAMMEYSKRFPDGQPIHIRSYDTATAIFQAAGFSTPEFRPFEIPVDLPPSGTDPTLSWTVSTTEDKRLIFRGGIYQPWCHVTADRV